MCWGDRRKGSIKIWIFSIIFLITYQHQIFFRSFYYYFFFLTCWTFIIREILQSFISIWGKFCFRVYSLWQVQRACEWGADILIRSRNRLCFWFWNRYGTHFVFPRDWKLVVCHCHFFAIEILKLKSFLKFELFFVYRSWNCYCHLLRLMSILGIIYWFLIQYVLFLVSLS